MTVSKKLFQLKQWLTIRDAAKQLSALLNEDVSEVDLYQLALDEKITISVYFPNGANAKKGRLIQFDDVKWDGFPRLDDCEYVKKPNGQVELIHKKTKPLIHFPDALLIDDDVPVQNARWLRFDRRIFRIDGVWDLAMIGAERIDIERLLLQEISGLSCDSINLEGLFLTHGDVWVNPQAEFSEAKTGIKDENNFYPSGGLDDFDHILVIKPSSIMNFLASLNDGGKKLKGRPRNLSDQEVEAIKNAHKSNPKITANEIAQEYGVSDSLIRRVWN